MGKAIWPTGTLSTQTVQIGDLATTLGQYDSDVGDMINEGMKLLMTDVPSFTQFASTGAWSSGTPFSLPSTVNGLDLGLKTFLVSTAMSKNIKGMTVVGVSVLLASLCTPLRGSLQRILQANSP